MRYDRRRALKLGLAAAIGSEIARRSASALPQTATVRMAHTPVLDIAYEETGNAQGFPAW